VLDPQGKLLGVVTAEALRIIAPDPQLASLTIAADVMAPPVALREGDRARHAIEVMLENEVREVPVLDAEGRIAGFVDEADVTRAYLEATAVPDAPPSQASTGDPGAARSQR